MPGLLSRANLTALVIVLAGILLCGLDAVQVQGLKLQDWQRRLLAAPERASERVILVEVDQYSLDRMQDQAIGWPWPRELYGGIAGFAAAGGAAAVVIDILFNNDSPCSLASDSRFAELLRNSGNTYLAAAFSRAGSGQKLPGIGLPIDGSWPTSVDRQSASLPLPELREAANGMGNVSELPDSDGTFRRITPAIQIGGRAVPFLALAPFAAGKTLSWEPHELLIGGRILTLDNDDRLWVNHRSEVPPYRRYSAYDVIQSYIALRNGDKPAIDPAQLDGAYLVVGYAAPGLYDLHPTPLSARSSGLYVHAAVIDNWLQGDFLTPLGPWWSGLLGVLLALAILGSLRKAERAWVAVGLPCLLILSAVGLGFVLLHFDILADTARLLLPAGMLFFVSGMQRLLHEQRQKEFRQKSLERMVSPAVANWLMAEPERLNRTGKLTPISVFFSDLADFTTISEQLGPAGIVDLLNEYLELVQQVIMREQGTLNKFIGDAVMAFWGAPKARSDPAIAAIGTALAVQAALRGFRFSGRLDLALETRIGIDHGVCLVGNIGSRERFEYTAIGDAVNQASRLEGLNKYYGTHILVSETAWAESKGAFAGRMIDLVQVKGKTQPVRIYQPLGRRDQAGPGSAALIEGYEAAWSSYRNRDWAAAKALLLGSPQLADDGPSKVLLERVRLFGENAGSGPEADWDGVWRYSTK